jgi:hypothetical protein
LSETNVADRGLCGAASDIRDLYRAKIIDKDLLKSVLRLLVLSDKSDREFLGMCRLIHEMTSILSGRTKGVEFRFLDTTTGDITAYLTSARVQQALAASVDAYQKQFPSFPFANDGLITDKQFQAFQKHPLDGKISLSFALQWRLQFPLLTPNGAEES